MVAGVNRVTHAPHGGKNGWKAALEIATNESISNGSDFRFLVGIPSVVLCLWFMLTGAETFFYRNNNSSLHSTYRYLLYSNPRRLPVPWFFKIED